MCWAEVHREINEHMTCLYPSQLFEEHLDTLIVSVAMGLQLIFATCHCATSSPLGLEELQRSMRLHL